MALSVFWERMMVLKISNVNNGYNSGEYNVNKSENETQKDFNSVIRQRIEYLEEKIKNGDTETSYAIGASSFTEREWDKLMTKIDSIQDKLREMMREEQKIQEERKECTTNG